MSTEKRNLTCINCPLGCQIVTGSREGARTVSVRTAGDVPKESVMDVVRALRGVAIRCPVKIGDVILEDAAGTGVAVVATKNAD